MKITDQIWQQALHWRARYSVGPADLRILLNPPQSKQLLRELVELMPGVLSIHGETPDSFQGMDIIVTDQVDSPMVVMLPHDFEYTLIS